MNTKKEAKGFTIIEVVLVLAIAGLIFLMVFIALPALQRNQRDTQRKNDLSRLQTAITSYTSNNRGALPATAAAWGTFVTNYVTINGNDSFIDPLGNVGAQTAMYQLTASVVTPLTGSFSSTTNQNIIFYSVGATCGTSGDTIVTGAGARKVAFRMYLEGGGITCVNN
ncbi:hypothetical protein CVV43_03765 [Candidatus Saccharibacteria bacterium HGW-Saccharibacteria-1]|jgi:prepilin-type N-terminal cleavage/methylation domain-containing protein|nr:MAG: hypothetical protein CVV43_03765 [Candidatus Saccharibacteria bacterium HGW-Saccharibacteria-1]